MPKRLLYEIVGASRYRHCATGSASSDAGYAAALTRFEDRGWIAR